MASASEWKAAMGRNWAARAEVMDRQLVPVAEIGMEVLAPRRGERILDLGCGPGATSLMLAEAVGPEGHVTGLDISDELLAIARRRGGALPQLDFIEADAQSHRFEGPAHDALFSRFGCMFFDDPVPAFANLRTGLKPTARAVFLVYTELAANPWARLPIEAGNAVLGPADPPKPGAPGPFGWSDPAIFEPILSAAGFGEVAWAPRDVVLEIGDPAIADPLERAVALIVRIGPLARRLNDQPETATREVQRVLAAQLGPYLDGDWVRMPGRIWVVTARA